MTGRRVGRAVDASMGLLTEIASKALEPDYAQAAARRASGHVAAPATPTAAALRAARLVPVVVLGLVLGGATMVAVLQLRTPDAGSSPRELLAREIDERSAAADALAVERDGVAAEVAALQEAALAADPALRARLEEAELLAGAVPVRGPGLVIVLEDGETAGEDGDPAARVQDRDLQVVTNALWAAGAEAVAVNGQRLTSLSPIRSAGEAILVGLAPVLPPYRVEAIGDVRDLQTSFARSTAAGHLTFLAGTYGITASTSSDTDLRLPGAPTAALRYARAPEGVASSAPSPGEGSP